MKPNSLKAQVIFLSIFFIQSIGLNAQPQLKFNMIVDGYDAPLGIVSAYDGSGRLFIQGKNGIISIFKNGSLESRPFLNFEGKILNSGESGFGGLVFHPDYKNNGYFFTYYNTLNGNVTISRWKVSSTDPDSADVNSEVVLFSEPKPDGYTNHNGSDMHFGKDGNLYISTGDGGSPGDSYNNAQNKKSFFGKILRINVDQFNTPPYYSIPDDNPFVNNPDYLPEVFALGFRNPWRWSFDKETGDMWIADVGQDSIEEVNYGQSQDIRGSNFGWHCYEADAPYNLEGCGNMSNYQFPIFQYRHDDPDGGKSIIGGFVYRGNLYPQLKGYYLCADFIEPHAWLIKPNGTGDWIISLQKEGIPDNISSIGEDENGELYASSINGQVYHIESEDVLHASLLSFTAKTYRKSVILNWSTANEINVDSFELDYSRDAIHFSTIAEVAPNNNQGSNTYTYEDNPKDTGIIYYRLGVRNKDNIILYSPIVPIVFHPTDQTYVYPTIVRNHLINIVLNDSFEALTIFDFSGRKILYKSLKDVTGTLQINLPNVATGIYFLRFDGVNPVSKKIFIAH
ncbi:MAG: PQQ-dependent sugar dehydrogenase [Bacteroidetes bacterium]|nr:PQQ-dependent sugar dehydrogenase [Bacteroidota bacterium]